jgi:hypothetical protein
VPDGQVSCLPQIVDGAVGGDVRSRQRDRVTVRVGGQLALMPGQPQLVGVVERQPRHGRHVRGQIQQARG